MPTNQQILDAMSEQFMQPQITRKLGWIELDGTNGIVALMTADFASDALEDATSDDPCFDAFADYYEGTIQSATIRAGYGARLSAPGYLDCTEWTVFDTEAEAEWYLVDTYGNDVELDDDDKETSR